MTKEPPSRLEIKVNAIQRSIEVLNTRIETLDRRLTERLDSLTGSVVVLTEQVGRFSEGLTKLENLVMTGFEDLKQTTRQQATHIDRLIGLVELSSKL